MVVVERRATAWRNADAAAGANIIMVDIGRYGQRLSKSA